MQLGAFDRIWFLTWTTYGTWLPGDERGFVSPKFAGSATERRMNEPGSSYDSGIERLRNTAKSRMTGPPILLTAEQAQAVRHQFEETAKHRGWMILAGAIMANHVHLVVAVTGDPDPSTIQRDLKSYASRTLTREFGRPRSETWWTEQGSRRKVIDWENLEVLLGYVREQTHPLECWENVGDGMTKEWNSTRLDHPGSSDIKS